MKTVIEASTAVALAVKMCRPAVIPIYPITPQTHIVERITEYINDGELESRPINAESEHSAISAAIGISATGQRTFTATSSQGLALMHEILFIAAGMRLPIVMAVANRALSAPINIWNDHQDSISERDAGWIQLYVESGQEALDTTIQAYKIAEDSRILLPIMVCLDGFTLTHVWEPVDVPEEKRVESYLPKYKPLYKLDVENPMTFGPIGFPDSFMHFKQAQQEAMQDSIQVIKKAHDDYATKFERSYGNGLVELYKMTDADYAIMAMGTVCGTTRVAIDELRKKGEKVGMIKVRSYRPFPKEEILKACSTIKAVGIIDRNMSLGNEGALYTDVRSLLYQQKNGPIVNGFICGLGGRDITINHINKIFENLKKEKETTTEWMH